MADQKLVSIFYFWLDNYAATPKHLAIFIKSFFFGIFRLFSSQA